MTLLNMTQSDEKQRVVPTIKQGRNRVNMNWAQLSAIINGGRAIDQSSLAIRNRDDAKHFASEYGFDLGDPADLCHIEDVHREALAFIEEFFLTEEEIRLVAPKVRKPDHVLDLLVYSSNFLNQSNEHQLWACVVLKVMHGIFHIDHDFKLKYFDTIRDQVFEALDKLVISDEGQQYLVGKGNVRIPIYSFEKKRNKGRHSVLLKLLQKPRYVAADIYDHLGIRLVFETKSECLFALQNLRRHHLVTVTNIKPFRSRNSLVDLNQARSVFKKYRPLLEGSKGYPYKILGRMDAELSTPSDPNRENPHSAEEYQAIQVTVRKMIHLPNAAQKQVDEILRLVGDKVDLPPHLTAGYGVRSDFTIYFDYEIQVLTKESWLHTLNGPSSHQAYKARQRETARTRVLGNALTKYLAENVGLASSSAAEAGAP